jgi:chemotaxis protein MotB
MKSILAAVSVLAAAAALNGCGVSKAKYLESTTSVDKLTAENQKLQADLKTANDGLSSASAKSADLEKQVASMQSSVDQLNAEVEKQKQATAEMQSTQDGLISQLQSEISSGKVQVEQMRDGLRVNLAQEILFKSGSANLDKAGKEILIKVAGELKDQKYAVNVIGHTDNQKIGASLQAKYATNWELGAARAGQIVRLFGEQGIEASRLAAVSAGEARPRADNATPEGRAQNRRIEIRLRPVESEGAAAAK